MGKNINRVKRLQFMQLIKDKQTDWVADGNADAEGAEKKEDYQNNSASL
jgi:hypothetical protein